MKRFLVVMAAAALGAAAVRAQAPAKAEAPVREFKSVNIEVKGNKIWTPAVFIAKKGDKVKITLVNAAESGVHGFAIEGYEVKTAVDNKAGENSKAVEFTADKAGVFRVYCHMHPAHVGGQLLVLD